MLLNTFSGRETVSFMVRCGVILLTLPRRHSQVVPLHCNRAGKNALVGFAQLAGGKLPALPEL